MLPEYIVVKELESFMADSRSVCVEGLNYMQRTTVQVSNYSCYHDSISSTLIPNSVPFPGAFVSSNWLHGYSMLRRRSATPDLDRRDISLWSFNCAKSHSADW
jgi:hypothetical protein